MNEEEKSWIANQRASVVEYARVNIDEYGKIGEVPAFHITSIVSIWAIESHSNHGRVGFWVFSGNLPGDVIPRNWNDKADNPRKALVRMNAIWKSYIKFLRNGKNPPNVKLGSSDQQRIQMADILTEKVTMFDEMVKDDGVWDDDCPL